MGWRALVSQTTAKIATPRRRFLPDSGRLVQGRSVVCQDTVEDSGAGSNQDDGEDDHRRMAEREQRPAKDEVLPQAINWRVALW